MSYGAGSGRYYSDSKEPLMGGPYGGSGGLRGGGGQDPFRQGGFDSRQPSRSRTSELLVTKTPGNYYAYVNLAVVSPADFDFKKPTYLLVNGRFVVSAVTDREIPAGSIGLTKAHRRWMRIMMGPATTARVEMYQPDRPDQPVGVITLEVGFASANSFTTDPIDEDELVNIFLNTFKGQLLSAHQPFLIEYRTEATYLQVVVTSIIDAAGNEIPSSSRGLITASTRPGFVRDQSGKVNLKPSRSRPAANALIDPATFDIKSLGVGGLDDEINKIVRRAFTSRGVAARDLEEFSIKHLKGILLYGPPGTGKTLMARELSRVLKAHPPKIVNGPEVLSKWVGQSEENIRALFAEAEAEFKEKGMDSTTHVIIFDELDAICKARGSGGAGGAGVNDNIVNQLLTKMDGVDELGNILIIGMTNRKDLIDPALLRPGRLELQIEISLPDEKGREDILNIVLAKAKEHGRLADDVNVRELAHIARNYTGAELTALWHAAFSYCHPLPTGRPRDPENELGDSGANLVVSRKHFLLAFDDVKAMHGARIDTLQEHIQYGIINFNDKVQSILNVQKDLVANLHSQSKNRIYPILLEGVPQSGTTSLAAKLALLTDAPSIQMIGPADLIGKSPIEVINALQDAFELAYKSEESVLVVDQIEQIIRWIDIGPRFVTDIVFTLHSLLSKFPPKKNRLVVIATTAKVRALDELDLLDPFKGVLTVPTIESASDLHNVLTTFNIRDPRVAEEFWEPIKRFRRMIGVKAVIESLSEAMSDPDSGRDPMAFKSDFVSHLTRRVQTKAARMRLPKDDLDELASTLH